MAIRCIVMPTALLLLYGCIEADEQESVTVECSDCDDLDRNDKVNSASAHPFLKQSDFDVFQPNKHMRDVLTELNWRGNFKIGGIIDGQDVYAIGYVLIKSDWSTTEDLERLLGGSLSDCPSCTEVWAIFVDDRLSKIVIPPSTTPDDVETVLVDGRTPWSRPKPLKLGDIRWLRQAMDNRPESLDQLKKELDTRPLPPTSYDPGLGVVVWLNRTFVGPPADEESPPTKEEFSANIKLRDQFNAARLRTGMDRIEVGAVLKAGPIDSGRAAGEGEYDVYGSYRKFNIDPCLHYSNVLVVLKDGKVNAIYSGGYAPSATSRVVDGEIVFE